MVAALVALCRSQHQASTSSQLAGCVATEQQLTQAVNQSNGGSLQQIEVNCLAYQDAQRTLELAVVSGYADSSSTRYTVECRSGLLVIEESLTLNGTNEKVACHECVPDSSVQLCDASNSELDTLLLLLYYCYYMNDVLMYVPLSCIIACLLLFTPLSFLPTLFYSSFLLTLFYSSFLPPTLPLLPSHPLLLFLFPSHPLLFLLSPSHYMFPSYSVCQ